MLRIPTLTLATTALEMDMWLVFLWQHFRAAQVGRQQGLSSAANVRLFVLSLREHVFGEVFDVIRRAARSEALLVRRVPKLRIWVTERVLWRGECPQCKQDELLVSPWEAVWRCQACHAAGTPVTIEQLAFATGLEVEAANHVIGPPVEKRDVAPKAEAILRNAGDPK